MVGVAIRMINLGRGCVSMRSFLLSAVEENFIVIICFSLNFLRILLRETLRRACAPVRFARRTFLNDPSAVAFDEICRAQTQKEDG